MKDPDYCVRAFKPKDAEAFARLNQRWIEEHFGMEEPDRRALYSPQETILDPGGYIAIAEMQGRAVGAGALMVPEPASHAPDWLELVKMATDPSVQGQGVGAAVLDHLIAHAQKRGASSIWLETNSALVAATKLYSRKGFQTLTKEDQRPTPYSRCNQQMRLTF